jgi:hypothetical protein
MDAKRLLVTLPLRDRDAIRAVTYDGECYFGHSAEQFRRMTMIRNFTEQSANERTFLAWLRTGIAVIAFGFVVEKFNLFMVALASAAGGLGRGIATERLSGAARALRWARSHARWRHSDRHRGFALHAQQTPHQ